MDAGTGRASRPDLDRGARDLVVERRIEGHLGRVFESWGYGYTVAENWQHGAIDRGQQGSGHARTGDTRHRRRARARMQASITAPGWIPDDHDQTEESHRMEIRAAVVRAPHCEVLRSKGATGRAARRRGAVELVATGICHTDIAIVEQSCRCRMPYVLGHEGAGVVVETGRAVTGLAKGDHVVLTFGSCGDMPRLQHRTSRLLRSHFRCSNFAGRRADGSATIHDAADAPVNAAFFGQSSFATHALAPSAQCDQGAQGRAVAAARARWAAAS